MHAPWCRYRCPYCAFNIYTSSNPKVEQWKDHVLRDWAHQRPFFSGNAVSLYIGGGTPSRLPISILKDLIPQFPLTQDAELGFELNPDDASESYISELIELGFNRFSLGIQSLQDSALQFLGRQHSRSQLLSLLDNMQTLPLKSWSMDFIFGLPEHIEYEMESDLQAIAQYRPPHISLYGLTIEPHTHFDRQVQKGLWQPLDSDQWEAAYHRIISFLTKLGYDHYEVSNFALPNHRSRHNESIWKGGNYAGLGPGAHAFLPNHNRLVQHGNWEKWTDKGLESHEQTTDHQRAIDLIITRLRHCDGFHLRELQPFGYTIHVSDLAPFTKAQMLLVTSKTIALGPAGWSIADGLSSALIDRLQSLES